MKLWTYKEALDKIVLDNDLAEIFLTNQAFVTKNEMIGYFNEALTDAESEIQAANKDYFLTKYYIPLVEGVKTYNLPENIMANKIRGILYSNGSLTYAVEPLKRLDKFENMELLDKYGTTNYYSYNLKNDYHLLS